MASEALNCSLSDNRVYVFCAYTYEIVLNVSDVYLRDLLLEFQRILNHADAAMDVVLEAVDVRSQVTSLSRQPVIQ